MTNEELLAKIKAEINKLYGEYKDKFHQSGDQYHLGLIDGLDMAERVLDTLESERTEPYNPVYDEAYLNEKIKKATESWKGVDVDAMLAECRGYDEEKSEKPMNPDDAMKALDEKIALVKQMGTWDGVDVDKYMDEVRGREPEKPMEGLEEEIDRVWKQCSPIDEGMGVESTYMHIEAFNIIARHFARWGAEHAKNGDEKPAPNDGPK